MNALLLRESNPFSYALVPTVALRVREPSPGEARSSPRLLDRVGDAIRSCHYSLRTEQSYVHWIRRFILFHGKRHPPEWGEPETRHFCRSLSYSPGWAHRARAATLQQARGRQGAACPRVFEVRRANSMFAAAISTFQGRT